MTVTMEMVLAGIGDVATRGLLVRAVEKTLQEARQEEERKARIEAQLRLERQAMYVTTFRNWVQMLPAELRPYARQEIGRELALLRTNGEQQTVELVFPGLEVHLRACMQWDGGAKVGTWGLLEYRMPTVTDDFAEDGRRTAVVDWSHWATCTDARWALCDLVQQEAELRGLRENCEAWNRANLEE